MIRQMPSGLLLDEVEVTIVFMKVLLEIQEYFEAFQAFELKFIEIITLKSTQRFESELLRATLRALSNFHLACKAK